MELAHDNDLHLITNYLKYKHALKRLNNICIKADDHLHAAVKQFLRPNTSTTGSRHTMNLSHSNANNNDSNATAASSTSDHVPPLTVAGHAQLVEYEAISIAAPSLPTINQKTASNVSPPKPPTKP
jgi:hypothetical protein